ncbi:hypothetical protein BDR07DRAFT_788850 [Suillus spraguei]|nr:hypothetical protein BDR07DRAFT_788850 [Suillus spraguei]
MFPCQRYCDDVCDSLKISYGHIRSIIIDVSNAPPHSKVAVHVDLTTPPSVGDVSLDIPAGQKLYFKFEIQREDLSRLMEALRRRGIVKLSFIGENPQKQANKRRSVGLAHSIRLSGDSPSPQGSQYELQDKVKHVENVYETNFPDDARSTIAHPEQESPPTQQAPPRTQADTPKVQEFKNHASAKCAPKTIPRPRPVSKSAKKVAPLSVTLPHKSPAKDKLPSAVHASVFGEGDDKLTEISDDKLPKFITNAFPIVHPVESVKAEPAPSLSAKSNSFQPAPPAKRIFKRRLIVDSDEEMRATPKAAQRLKLSSAKPDMNVETITTELGKTRRIDDRRSSILPSSSTIETDHPESIPLEVKRPCTPSSKEPSHPGPIDNIHLDDNILNDPSAYDQVPPCKTIPDAQLTAHGIIPTSPVKKTLATGKGTVWGVSPPKHVDSANVPVKLAGTRRKRDDANPPTTVHDVLEDDHPPKKKARNTASSDMPVKRAANILPDTFELSTLSTTVAKAPRKYGKKGKVLSPVAPDNVDFDEVPGATSKGKTNARTKAVRTSKPASKKVPAPISGRQTRAGAVRSRNEKPPELESPKDINPKHQPAEVDTGIVTAPEPVVESIHHDATNGPSVSFESESALRKQVNKTDMDRAGVSTIAPKNLTKSKTRNTNAVNTEKKPSTSERARTPKPKRAPWEEVFTAQHAPTDGVKPLGVSPPDSDPLEPIQDITPGDVDGMFFGDFIDYSVSLKGSEDPIIPASSDPPLLQLTPRKLPVCIDLTLDPTPVKSCHDSAKDRGVAKDTGILSSKGQHPVEGLQTSVTVPVALHPTGRQDGHGTYMGVSKPSTDVAMDDIMSQDPSPLPQIPSCNEKPQEQLAVSNIPPTLVRINDAEGCSIEPRGVRPSPSVPVRQQQLAVSFASPLVTRPGFGDAVQTPTMICLKSDVRSNNHGAFGNSIPETNTCQPKGPDLDHVISPVSDDEFESSHTARKPFSIRVRSENVRLPCSPSPLTLKTSAHSVKQMSG